MLMLDRGLSILMILGAAGHTFGVMKVYKDQPQTLFWALGGTLLILLVAGINLLRAKRPHDRALGWLAAGAAGAYTAFSIGFGILVDNPFDPRVVIFALASLGLVAFSLRTALKG